MENASKALIIAGAVILSVLIITLGFYIYDQAAGIAKNVNMTEYEIQAYNSKFIDYEGKKSGTKARELCDVIKQHNIANAVNKKNGIFVYYGGATWGNFTAVTADTLSNENVDEIKSRLKTGKFYEINLTYDNAKGIVSAIQINEI